MSLTIAEMIRRDAEVTGHQFSDVALVFRRESERLQERNARLVVLLQEARTDISHDAWAGGASHGYYCKRCHRWENNEQKPKTSPKDIVHTPECILSRIDAALAENEPITKADVAPASGAHVQRLDGQTESRETKP